eukprot:340546-Prorocentrum_minimum.AAC.1
MPRDESSLRLNCDWTVTGLYNAGPAGVAGQGQVQQHPVHLLRADQREHDPGTLRTIKGRISP